MIQSFLAIILLFHLLCGGVVVNLYLNEFSLSNCPQIYMALGSAESNSSIKKAKAKISVKELGMQILNHSACEVEFKLFENETHGSVIEKAMIWAIENIKSEPID